MKTYLLLLVFFKFSFCGVSAQDDSIMFGADQMVQQPVYCDDTYQWMCQNGECIARYDVCDGITQCEDGSDEANCNEPNHNFKPHPPTVQPSRQVHLQPKANVTTTAIPTIVAPNSLSLKLAALGLFVFVGLAALVHTICKRRKANKRNVRKGESLLDDEDDLLISQMYA